MDEKKRMKRYFTQKSLDGMTDVVDTESLSHWAWGSIYRTFIYAGRRFVWEVYNDEINIDIDKRSPGLSVRTFTVDGKNIARLAYPSGRTGEPLDLDEVLKEAVHEGICSGLSRSRQAGACAASEAGQPRGAARVSGEDETNEGKGGTREMKPETLKKMGEMALAVRGAGFSAACEIAPWELHPWALSVESSLGDPDSIWVELERWGGEDDYDEWNERPMPGCSVNLEGLSPEEAGSLLALKAEELAEQVQREEETR